MSVISFGSSVFLAITTVFFLFGVSSAFGFSKGEVWFRVFGNAMMMGIYLIASVFLFRFTRAVRNLAQNRDNAALGHFLDTLRKLWKCLGIIVVVILAQWLVFLLAAPVFGAKAQNAPGDTAQEVPIESSTD